MRQASRRCPELGYPAPLEASGRALAAGWTLDAVLLLLLAHTGWRRVGGRDVYLHGGGAVGSEGLYLSVAKLAPRGELGGEREPERGWGE